MSAGRVQSVAVRLITEREREIQGFVPEPSFKVKAFFQTSDRSKLEAKGTKDFENFESAEQFLEKNKLAVFTVSSLEKKPAKKSPAAPFTTSTLQQEASRKLYFPSSKNHAGCSATLYEAGLITYMRTDSVNLSPEAIAMISSEIEDQYDVLIIFKIRSYSTKSKGAQEAHEAIRPTQMSNKSPNLGRDEARTL